MSEPNRIAALNALVAIAVGLAIGVGVNLMGSSGSRSGSPFGAIAGAMTFALFSTAKQAFAAGRRAHRIADGSPPPVGEDDRK